MKKKLFIGMLAVAVVVLAGASSAAYQGWNCKGAGVGCVVGDLEFFNNSPTSDWNTAVAEEPTIRLDGSAGGFLLGVGDTTAPTWSLTYQEANIAVIGAGDSLAWEGAADNAFEIIVSAADVTGDVVLTLPLSNAANAAFMVSALVTNSPQIANSVWGESNAIHMEGASADDFEVIITPADVTADMTVTIPDGNSLTLGTYTVTYTQGPTSADAISGSFWIADRAYIVTGVQATWDTAESTGDMDVMLEKLVAVTACGSGTDMLSAVIDASTNGGGGVANTTATGSLHATPANFTFAAGDTMCIVLTVTPNEIAGLTVTVAMEIR